MAIALVGHSLLRAMSKNTDDLYLSQELKESARDFSLLAAGVLDECQSDNADTTKQLLTRVIPYLGDSTCIEIAVSSSNRYFISKHACQSLLMSVWYGHLSVRKNSGVRKVIGAVFFIFAPFIMKFKKKLTETEDGNQTSPTGDKVREKKTSRNNSAVHPEDSSRQQNRVSQPAKTAWNKSKDNERKTQTVSTSEVPNGKYAEISLPKRMLRKMCDYCTKMKYFFIAPVIIFTFYTLSYLCFLGLFSFVLVVQMKPNEWTREDAILVAWVVSYLFDELRQMYREKYAYFVNAWNYIDHGSILAFGVGMGLRWFDNRAAYDVARTFLCFDFSVFGIRLMAIFMANRELGPKILMIGRMIVNLVYFMMIFVVIITVYAVSSHALLYPNSELTYDTVRALFRRPFWNIYGELFLDTIEGDAECSSSASDIKDRCPADIGTYVVPVMMGFYMLLMNFLLLNLLIAMFSSTFTGIHKDTDLHWKNLRYAMISEYYQKPWLFPPLNLLLLFYWLMKWLCCSCICGWKENDDNKLRSHYVEADTQELMRWESVQMLTFLTKEERQNDGHISNRLDVLAGHVLQKIDMERMQQSIGKESFPYVDPYSDPRPSTGISRAGFSPHSEKLFSMPTHTNSSLAIKRFKEMKQDSYGRLQEDMHAMMTDLFTKQYLQLDARLNTLDAAISKLSRQRDTPVRSESARHSIKSQQMPTHQGTGNLSSLCQEEEK